MIRTSNWIEFKTNRCGRSRIGEESGQKNMLRHVGTFVILGILYYFYYLFYLYYISYPFIITRISVPLRTTLFTLIDHPWRSTMRLTSASPKPNPSLVRDSSAR